MMKLWISLLTATVILLTGCTEQQSSAKEEVELLEVIDGDTIRIEWNGEEETVRYLLVDTPETNHPRLGKQPYGEEAKELNKELLEGKTISIELDIGERYDDYGRLLAYVYADGERVQDQLIASGVARVAYAYPPNIKYLDEFERIQETARDQEVGIWQYDYYVTDYGFDASSFDQQDSQCLIKGNINREGDKIYHVPSGRYYSQTNPEEWFCSEKEAKQAGFRKSME